MAADGELSILALGFAVAFRTDDRSVSGVHLGRTNRDNARVPVVLIAGRVKSMVCNMFTKNRVSVLEWISSEI